MRQNHNHTKSILVAAGLSAILCLPAAAGANPGPAEAGVQKEDLVIARVKGDRVDLNTEKLRTKLEDGRVIKQFRIMRHGDRYQLLRVSEVDGKRFTEGIPLKASKDGRLAFELPESREVKWITTCFPGTCDGFCVPGDGRCDCFGPSGDLPGVDQVFDVEEEFASSGTAGASGTCTFGSVGGGLFDVLILH